MFVGFSALLAWRKAKLLALNAEELGAYGNWFCLALPHFSMALCMTTRDHIIHPSHI